MTRQHFAAALQRVNLDVDVAESASEAKRLIDRFGSQYCCILLDLLLPDADGSEVARHVRTEFPKVPVLVVTGQSGDMRDLPVAQYPDVVRMVIRKPVDLSSISDLVSALGEPRIPIR